jgi:hypothetical protein
MKPRTRFSSMEELLSYVNEYGKSQECAYQSRSKTLQDFSCDGHGERFGNVAAQEAVWISLKLPDYQLCNSCHKDGSYPAYVDKNENCVNSEEDFVCIEDNLNATFYRGENVALLDTIVTEYKLPNHKQLQLNKILKIAKLWFLGDYFTAEQWMYTLTRSLNGIKGGILHHPEFGSIRGWIPFEHYSPRLENCSPPIHDFDQKESKQIILTKDEQIQKVHHIWALVNCDVSNSKLFGQVATAVLDANLRLGINTSQKTIQDYFNFQNDLLAPYQQTKQILSQNIFHLHFPTVIVEIISEYSCGNAKANDCCLKWRLHLKQPFLFY